MDMTNQAVQKDAFYNVVNELLTVTNSVVQDGNSWTLRFATPIEGISANQSYGSREAAVQGVVQVLRGRAQSRVAA